MVLAEGRSASAASARRMHAAQDPQGALATRSKRASDGLGSGAGMAMQRAAESKREMEQQRRARSVQIDTEARAGARELSEGGSGRVPRSDSTGTGNQSHGLDGKFSMSGSHHTLSVDGRTTEVGMSRGGSGFDSRSMSGKLMGSRLRTGTSSRMTDDFDDRMRVRGHTNSRGHDSRG